MAAPPVTAVEAALARRRRFTTPLAVLLILALLAGVIVLIGGVAFAIWYGRESTPHYADATEHFKYGSIGAEPRSGIPYHVWQALPRLFPEVFRPAVERGAGPYSVFGFLYETDADGKPRDLPIGLSRRTVNGVDMVWFNCSVCHVGTWRMDAASPPQIVLGMPSNNLDLGGFVNFLLGTAAVDMALGPENLIEQVEANGEDLGFVERLFWQYGVAPRLREGLIERSSRLMPLMHVQPAWGPGRVDTFNPYKVVQLKVPAAALSYAFRVNRWA